MEFLSNVCRKMKTELYHCTKFDNLLKILDSRTFYPSFCLEDAEYLYPKKLSFAFAMVSFADLLPSELKRHLRKFSANAYLSMSKRWAINNNLSSVCYYQHNGSLPAALKCIINEVANGPKDSLLWNVTGYLQAFLKPYEGKYWDKKRYVKSTLQTSFYLEREWRYIPMVLDDECFFLTENDYLNNEFQMEKREELIQKKYVLNFEWQDILSIGVSSINQYINVYKLLRRNGLGFLSIIKIVRIV